MQNDFCYLKLRSFLIVLAAFLPLLVFSNNLETWNTIQIQKKIDDFYVGISEESRLGVNQTEKKLDEFHTTLFADWRFAKFMSIGIQDDLVCLRDGSDARYKRDNRPSVNVAFYGELEGFQLMNRSRFVMRDLQDERPYFRYRNLSKVTAPIILQSKSVKDIRPYVSYEWYFDEGSKDRHIRKNDKFSQFWIDFGIQGKLCDKCIASIFYRLVEVKNASGHDWSPGHVVGASISLTF